MFENVKKMNSGPIDLWLVAKICLTVALAAFVAGVLVGSAP